MASIFERPPHPWTRTDALNDEQEARARALLIAADAAPGLAVGEQIAMAEYITGGPAGFAVFSRMLHEPDDDVTEIKDATGRTLFTSGPTRDPWTDDPRLPDEDPRDG